MTEIKSYRMQVSIGIKAVLPGFIEPCQPSKVAQPPPSGPLWFHEIKFDGYRLMVRRGGARVRCFTRNGHDWADRFPVSGDLHVSMTRLAARIA